MNNKRQLIKTGFFTFSTILVLVVATLAWFAMGNDSGADPVSGEIGDAKFLAVYYQSPDADKDGVKDVDPDTGDVIWTEIKDRTIDLRNLVPGENRFYKIEVTTTNVPIDLEFFFDNIQTVLADGTTATKSDVLGRINAEFMTRDSSNNPIAGTATINSTFLALMGNDPDETRISIYDMDLSGYPETTFTIYYTISVPAGHTPTDALVQGSGITIGTTDFLATEQ